MELIKNKDLIKEFSLDDPTAFAPPRAWFEAPLPTAGVRGSRRGGESVLAGSGWVARGAAHPPPSGTRSRWPPSDAGNRQVEAGGRASARRRRSATGWRAGRCSLPIVALLIVFFLLPIYFIVRYSLGLERFARTEAAAVLTGELGAFSTELWRDFLGVDVALEILGLVGRSRSRPGCSRSRSSCSSLGAVFGTRGSRRWGGWIAGGSFLLLLAPFLTIPAGNNLLRLGRAVLGRRLPAALLPLRHDGHDLGGLAVLIAFPIAYFLAFGIEVEADVAPDRDRAVPDELPASHLRLEDHPGRPGDHQHGRLRDGPPRRREPALVPHLQPVHRHPRAALRLGAVHRACRSSSRSRTWTGACSRHRPTSARAGLRRFARSRSRSPRPASSPRSCSSSSRPSASTSPRRSSEGRAATCSARRSPTSSSAARSTGRSAPCCPSSCWASCSS